MPQPRAVPETKVIAASNATTRATGQPFGVYQIGEVQARS
jgi:hypothetical protein